MFLNCTNDTKSRNAPHMINLLKLYAENYSDTYLDSQYFRTYLAKFVTEAIVSEKNFKFLLYKFAIFTIDTYTCIDNKIK